MQKNIIFNNPLTHIQININTKNSERFDGVRDGAEKLTFDVIFKRTKARLTDEIAEMFHHKKSMTLRLGVKFEVGKIDIDPFDDFDFEEELEFHDMESFQNHLKIQKEKEKKEKKNLT